MVTMLPAHKSSSLGAMIFELVAWQMRKFHKRPMISLSSCHRSIFYSLSYSCVYSQEYIANLSVVALKLLDRHHAFLSHLSVVGEHITCPGVSPTRQTCNRRIMYHACSFRISFFSQCKTDQDPQDGAGTCQQTSDCTTQGFNLAGYCPGSSSIQCCVKKSCSTSSGSGTCMNTGDSCSGSFISGACPGDSSIKVYEIPE